MSYHTIKFSDLKSIITILLMMIFFSALTANAQDVVVNWDFENGDDHGFTVSSLVPATPAADDPTTAGDEALTGGWDEASATNLPQAGVTWVVGSAAMINGQLPGADPAHARIDTDGLLDYSLGKPRIGYINTGSLNTYLLNMHGDFVHADSNDQIASSPVVTLGDNMFLSATSWGGGPGLAPQFDADPTKGYVTGSSGIAVLSASDSSLLASLGMGNHGNIGVDTLDLSAFAGQDVFIQVVDAFQGGWGWLAVDEIQIGTEILPLPEPAIDQVNWDFEDGNDHGFTLSSLVAATPAADDPMTAGDESLTGGWDEGNATNLPQAGVTWVAGSPAMINGQLPGADPDHARIDTNGVLDYSLGKPRIGYLNTGSLNTYLLNMHGDFIHADSNDQVASSPPVLLGDNMFLSATSWGGGPGLAPEFDEDPEKGYKTGSSGIAVLLAEDGSLLASLGMGNHGNLGVDTLDLSPFGGLEVIIEVVDAFQGGWGWLAIDEIHIGTEILQLPAPPEQVVWDFENGNDEGFTLSSLVPATPAADDPTVAGDESLTGGWEASNANNLPEAGVVWVAGTAAMFNGQLPGADPANARIDSNGVLDYSLGKARIGTENTGSLNTYLLNMHGDGVHNEDNDQIATSPPVLLGDNMWLSALSWGGGPGLAPEFDADPDQGYATGSSGIAVLSATDSSLLASMGMGNHGNLGVDSLDLSPFAGLQVIFQVVDAFQGGWGWLAVEKIQIGPEILEIPPALGLLAHWKFDETSGTTANDELSVSHASLINMGDSSWVTGWSGNAIDWTNATDSGYVEVANNPTVDMDSTESFSISFLVNADPVTSTVAQELILKGSFSSTNGIEGHDGKRYQMEFKDGQLRVSVDDDIVKSQLDVNVTGFYPVNQWVHVVGVRDLANDSLFLYLNGDLIGSLFDGTDTDISNSLPLLIGSSFDGADNLNGQMDDLRIYDHALNTDEIKALFESYTIVVNSLEFEPGGATPVTYSLKQNYPNPFNPTTTIDFSLRKAGLTTLTIYNVLGQQVATLLSKKLSAGNYSVEFDAINLASGMYFYRLSSGEFTKLRKMLLIK